MPLKLTPVTARQRLTEDLMELIDEHGIAPILSALADIAIRASDSAERDGKHNISDYACVLAENLASLAEMPQPTIEA